MDVKTSSIRQGHTSSPSAAQAAKDLWDAIGHKDMAYGVFFASHEYDFHELSAEIKKIFGDLPLVGCSASGEVGHDGYLNHSISGFSFGSDFAVATSVISDLANFKLSDGENAAARLITEMTAKVGEPNGSNSFGMLLIDGLSRQEEAVVSAIHRNLGDISLFGGSASDDVKFDQAYMYHRGDVIQDGAIFTLVHTKRPFTVFKTQHFDRTQTKMVVTAADPATRTVREINGEPATREYARTVGLDYDELSPTIFATYPVAVRVGGVDYIRSIMTANPDDSITFVCAIDEGIVLSVAKANSLVDDLTETLSDIRTQVGEPEIIIGCDCLFRRIECDETDIRDEVGRIMAENKVVAFATYGEQFNAMHVNQTFTGVAIGFPKDG